MLLICSSLSHSHNCCITFCSHLLGQRCRQDMYPVQIQRWRLHFDIHQHNWYVGGWNSYNLKLCFWAEIFHSESDTVVEIEIVNTKKMCKDSGRSWKSQRTAAADESLCFFASRRQVRVDDSLARLAEFPCRLGWKHVLSTKLHTIIISLLFCNQKEMMNRFCDRENSLLSYTHSNFDFTIN